MRVVVVGAGITGLAAGHAVLEARPGTDVVVLDAAPRPGGKIHTSELAGRRVDCAADAFLARVPEAVELCRRLGLGDELVTPATGRAYLYARGALRAFPTGLVLGVPTDLDALSASGVVSERAVARAADDLTMSETEHPTDESVGDLVRRRVGDEVFETLVAPLLSGVYAGDADQLSAEVVAPQFVAALREHGSLIAGLRAQTTARNPDAPVFYGLRGGTGSLIDALVRAITAAGGRVELGWTADRVTARDAGLAVTGPRGVERADRVIVTTPDHVTAALLAEAVPVVAHDLGTVPYASVAVVTLAFEPDAVGRSLDGSGFLVPAAEGLLLTACSWASSKWAHLGGGPAILRASVGRLGDDRWLALDDDALVAAVLDDLRATMDVLGRPVAQRVSRWPLALPQFHPGHGERVLRWRTEVARSLPGVELAGAGIAGLGIPTCIRQASEAADRVVGPRREVT